MRLPDVFSNRRAPLPWGIGMRPMRIPTSIAYGLPLPAGEYVGDDIDRDEWEALALPLLSWRAEGSRSSTNHDEEGVRLCETE